MVRLLFTVIHNALVMMPVERNTMKQISDELYKDIKNMLFYRSTTYPVDTKRIAFRKVVRETSILLKRLENEENDRF